MFARIPHILVGVAIVAAWIAPAQADAPPVPAEKPQTAELETAPSPVGGKSLQEFLKSRPDAQKLLNNIRERARRGPHRPSALRKAPPTKPAFVNMGPPAPVIVPDPFPALYRPRPVEEGRCPNVVMLILDTLRPDKLGCYGFTQKTSPALDKLAEQGVVFENVLTQSTWTRPSIGSMLTSRYPRELGIYLEQDQVLADEFTTLAEILKAQGYHTIGLTANPNINKLFNFHQGFDQYVDSDVLFFWMPIEDGKLERGVSPLPGATDMFNNALGRVNATGNQGPYYLQFNLMEVHEWIANRPGTNLLRPEYEWLFAPRDKYVKYLQLIRQLTDDIGQFVDQLTGLPGWEDTIFIFTSDHGEGLGDHRLVDRSSGHGFTLYESVARVPWIIYQAGWKPERGRIQQEVRLLDVVPTLLDMLGVPQPAEMKGVSLLPVITGEARVADIPRYQVIETEFGGSSKIALYGKRFKYIENRTPHTGLPPSELQPRGGHENGPATSHIDTRPEVAAGMKKYLDEWELRHPRRPPTAPHRALTPQEVEQLQNIGYL